MTIVVIDNVCGVTIVAKVTDRLLIDYCCKSPGVIDSIMLIGVTVMANMTDAWTMCNTIWSDYVVGKGSEGHVHAS